MYSNSAKVFGLIRVSDPIDHIIGQRTLTGVLSLRDVFQPIIEGFNKAAFTQHQGVEGLACDDFHVTFQGSNTLNDLLG